jgi:zinc/manganese transport system substrate-binding protein
MRRTLTSFALVAACLLATSCGGAANDESAASPQASAPRPTVVVTFAPYASLVADLVGDEVEVVTVVPNGTDPHDFSPSAADVAKMRNADLIVANGLGLEEGLDDVIDQAEASGVPVFAFADHVTLQKSVVGHHHSDDGHGHSDDKGAVEKSSKDEDDDGAEDPHLWLDPLAVVEAADELSLAIKEATGVEVTVGEMVARLQNLDTQVRDALVSIPAEDRVLVAGHDSLGYFATRYEFEFVGSLVQGFSSAADVSAADVADLVGEVEEFGVSAIFVEEGTPDDVVAAIADQTGTKVVVLRTHSVPEGGYAGMLTELATTIAGALAP